MEDKKKVGMVATIVTVLLCGCPGLCAIIFGVVFAQGYALENYGVDVTGDPEAFSIFGIMGICAGVIGVLLTIGAGVYWLVQSRKATEFENIEVPDPIE